MKADIDSDFISMYSFLNKRWILNSFEEKLYFAVMHTLNSPSNRKDHVEQMVTN